MKTIEIGELATVVGGQLQTDPRTDKVLSGFGYSACMARSTADYINSTKSLAQQLPQLTRDQAIDKGLAASSAWRAANRACDQLPE